MTPAARIQTAIELLERIANPRPDKARTPADTIVSGFMRGRRYIGSKDRRAIIGLVFGVLRHLPTLDWLLDSHDAPPRQWLIAWLLWRESKSADEVDALFSGGDYGPPPVSDDERDLFGRISGRASVLADAPAWAQGAFPEWLDEELARGFGDDRTIEMAAFASEAPVDLRVNTLKSDREALLAVLRDHDVEARPTPVSPWGIRLAGRANLQSLRAFQDGWFEVQDEAAQVVSALTGASPGEVVLDYCAGAGGKSLAMAAMMAGQGTLVAHDVSHVRLKPLVGRAGRAGVSELIRLFAAEDDTALSADAFDCVLVDAPCSGTGTWRRQPEGRLRLGPDELADLTGLQKNILATAARHVAPGGRLVYVSCSVLPCENGNQIQAFLADHDEFQVVDPVPLWQARLPGEAPVVNGHILLTPLRHGTDGFFCAILLRGES